MRTRFHGWSWTRTDVQAITVTFKDGSAAKADRHGAAPVREGAEAERFCDAYRWNQPDSDQPVIPAPKPEDLSVESTDTPEI